MSRVASAHASVQVVYDEPLESLGDNTGLDGFAARLRELAGTWDRDGDVPTSVCLEFVQLSQRVDMPSLCEAMGESLSLGLVLRLLAPKLAAEVVEASQVVLPLSAVRFAASAPWFGADQVSLTQQGDHYLLSGVCDAVVAPRTSEQLLVWAGGARYAVVPLCAAGVACEPRTGSLGAAALGRVRLHAVRLSADNVGELPAGAFERLRTRHLTWLARALCSFSHALLDSTLAFVGTRPFRGGVLSDAAAVRHRLAELSVHPQLFSAQLEAATQGTEDAALRSLLLAETLSEQLPVFIKQCQQLHGGRGFLMDHSVARAYRDVLDLSRLLGSRSQLRRSLAQHLPELSRLRETSAAFGSGEHRAFRAHARQLIAREVTPGRERWESDPNAIGSLHTTFAREGVTTLRLGRAASGGGRDFGYSFILAEELMAAAPAGVAVSLMIAAGAVVPLLAREASARLREELWPRLEQGRAVLSFGVTEPDGGSDLLSSLQTRAVDAGETWVLNGRKLFITNGPIADFVLVLARTSDQPGPFHSSFIVVPTDAPGVRVSEPYETLGLCASPTGWVELRDVHVPKHNLVGRSGLGMHLLASAISEERTLIAAGVLALAWNLVHDALCRFVGAGSVPCGQVGAPDRLLTWLARLDALRSLALETAQSIVFGEQDYAAAGLVKLAASEAAQEALEYATEALATCAFSHGVAASAQPEGPEASPQRQALAAPTPTPDPRYHRALRDTRVFSVFAGTNETLRDLVGASLAARARSLAPIGAAS